MANKKDDARSIRGISKKIDRLSRTIDNIYQSTYKSRIGDRNNLQRITGDIEDGLDDILTKINGQDVSDISKLYLRAQQKGGNQTMEIAKSLEELFDSNGNILDTINMNVIRQSIQSQDYQYDLICRYMPKLKDALEIKKDNVLSSDSFTKEFIHAASRKSGKKNIQLFSDRANLIKKKYAFEEKVEEIYWDMSKYGEYFQYHVPYKKGFERLLKRKAEFGTSMLNPRQFSFESAKVETLWESSSLSDSSNTVKFDSRFIQNISDNGGAKVTISINDTNMIPEAFSEIAIRDRFIQENAVIGLTESYIASLQGTPDNILPLEEEKLPNFDDTGLSPEGLVSNKKGKNQQAASKLKDDITGSIVYKIPRDQIIPIYISDICVGYLYLIVNNNFVKGLTSVGSSYNSLMNNSDLLADEWDRQNDMLVNQIAGTISDKIDAEFINANLDLKEEIYAILRYNDKFCSTRGTNNITCTFLPVEDVQHFYFKMNPKTHRGISDLEDAAVPAMIWCMAYLNDAIARMSRGQDKRVYYVRQTVEKNVARTMLNTIAQLKKGNMGMRQLENMNTVFNVIGKFNDHVIPEGPDGNPPIRMEVLQGQDIQTPTDLMDRMEEQAIFTTDVPPEFLQSVQQVDFATRFTMSNSKFLRKVLARQNIFQKQITKSFQKFYTFEFGEYDSSIIIRLPAPAFLSVTNTKQLMDNAKEYATGIAELICDEDEDENIKNEVISLYTKKNLATYIDFDEAENILSEARMNIASRKEVSDMGDGGDSEDDYSDDF